MFQWKADEIAKKLDEEVKKYKSPSKGSPRIKSKMDAKEERKKEKAKKSLSKLQKKGERAKAAKNAADKKGDNTSEDMKKQKSGENEVLEISDSDSDTPLASMKTQLTPKKKSVTLLKSPKDNTKKKKTEPNKENDKKKSVTLADMKKKMEKKKSLSLADLKEQMDKKKKAKKSGENRKERGSKDEKKKTKKGQVCW